MPFAAVNGQRIHYADSGGARPVVVFSHGFFMDQDMWDPQVEELRPAYRCLSISARGFGLTESDGEPFTYWDLADDIVAVMDDAKVGHRDPRRASHRVGSPRSASRSRTPSVCAPSCCATPTAKSRPTTPSRCTTAPRTRCSPTAGVRPREGHGQDALRTGLRRVLLDRAVADEPAGADRRRRSTTSSSATTSAIAWATSACPALILHGELDATMPLERAPRTCARASRTVRASSSVSDAGHTSNLENRDEFNLALRPFVIKHSALTMTYDFFSYETVADPYPAVRPSAREDPVFETNFGYWYVSRYDDANRLLRDGTLGRGARRARFDGHHLGSALRPDDHVDDGDRRARAHPRTPSGVAGLHPARRRGAAAADPVAWPTAWCDELAAHGGGDIVADYAFPLPDGSRAHAVRDRPRRVGRQRHRVVRPVHRVGRRRTARADGRARRVVRRRGGSAPEQPRATDMFSAMLAPDENGDALSTPEAVANAVLLVTAGFETTMSLITLAVWSLLTNPANSRRCGPTPTLAAGAVEETLRHQPAALSTTRSTPADLGRRRDHNPGWVERAVSR